jgi:hypothetical protein
MLKDRLRTGYFRRGVTGSVGNKMDHWLESGNANEVTPFRTVGTDRVPELHYGCSVRKLMTKNLSLISACVKESGTDFEPIRRNNPPRDRGTEARIEMNR